MISIPKYPVHSILPLLKKNLSDRKDCIIVSPPGSGKSTILPLELINEKWTENKKIYLLEPRRMAAKNTAGRMSSLLGEKTGESVGYRIRMESMVSAVTKIEVISEGIFTRIIQNDPELKNAALVIFDEFHERNAASDLGLALFLKSREVYETGCRLMIMSATLDASSVQKMIPGSEILNAEGRMFPVTVRYIKSDRPLSRDSVLTSVRSAVGLPGDILFFLPGMREIRFAESLVREMNADTDLEIRILHSEIPASEQEEILKEGGKKKRLILSTNIAETSLTVPGVMTVIDSGLVKQMRYSPSNGMEELVTERISLSSAEQRKGRAGRLAEGTVFRLYSVSEEKEFSEFPEAEILRTDLSSPILESLNYGVSFRELSFLEKIPESKITAAETVLQEIGVLDSAGNLTALGKKISRFGIHPRLSAMILRSAEIGLEVQACRLGAVLSEPDIQDNEFRFRSDLNLRLERVFRGNSDFRTRKIYSLSEDLLKRTENTKKYDVFQPEKTGLIAAFAFPERIGRKRGNGKFKLSSGKLAVCAENDPTADNEFICAAEITGDGTDNRIRRAAKLDLSLILKHFDHLIRKETRLELFQKERLKKTEVQKLLELEISEKEISEISDSESLEFFSSLIRKEGISVFSPREDFREIQKRSEFLRISGADFLDISDSFLSENPNLWIEPYLYGVKRVSELKKISLISVISEYLGRKSLNILEKEAPERFLLPSGSRAKVAYFGTEARVSARLQELFGLLDTPRLAFSRSPVVFEILSPSMRPVQVTSDLRNFWTKTYFEVKKELKGEYPKHYWPDDPFTAQAIRGVRPK